MACDQTKEDLSKDLADLKQTVELAALVICRVDRELKRLGRRFLEEMTSPLPPESAVEPLNPELPLRDQLKFNAKPEPLSGQHAERLVNAARSGSTDDSNVAKHEGCSE